MVPFAYASDVGPFTGTAVGGTINYSSQPGTTYTKMVEKATGPITSNSQSFNIPNTARTTLGNGHTIDAKLVTDISKNTVRQGIWNAIKKGKSNPWVTACFVLCPPLIDQGWEWMNDAKEWVKTPTQDPVDDGYLYVRSYGTSCSTVLGPSKKSEIISCYESIKLSTGCYFTSVGGTGTGLNLNCKSTNTGSYYTVQFSRHSAYTVSKVPVTDSDLTVAVDNAMNSVSPSDLITIADNSFYTIGADGIPIYQPIPIYDARQYVTPTENYISSPEKTIKIETVKNPDGTTTTTETKQKEVTNVTTNNTSNSTVNNTSLTYNTTTITNTYVNGSTTPTTTTETKKDEQDTGSVTDKTMPDLPELYKPKYPDGPQGVWNSNKPRIETTAFYQGIRSMFPNFGGGSCPVFSIPSIALGPFGNFGSFVFDVPCWIYQAIGLILMTTAAFTARKIIF